MGDKSLSVSWFNTSVERDKEGVKRDLEVAKPAFKLLTEILKGKVIQPSVKDYQNAAWPYFRADADGYNRAINDILKLIGD